MGLPLPGVTVKVAPLPHDSDQDEQDTDNFVEGKHAACPGRVFVPCTMPHVTI